LRFEVRHHLEMVVLVPAPAKPRVSTIHYPCSWL
jgi:hypothetical protein